MTIDIEEIKRRHGEETRQHRCRSCRGMFPCETLEMAREIERLRGGTGSIERLRAAFAVLEAEWIERDGRPPASPGGVRESYFQGGYRAGLEEQAVDVADLSDEVERLTADVAFRKEQISELIDQRDLFAKDLNEANRAIQSGQKARAAVEAERDRANDQLSVYAEDFATVRDRLARVESERDNTLGRLATAYEDAGTFRRQRDELVRLVDRKLMPAYFELCKEAGFPDVSQSEAVKMLDKVMAPYRETLERRTEPEGATP